MPGFRTSRLTAARDAVAPDGSDMRILLRLTGGGMAHFALPPGETSTAVTHRTVEEIWFILSRPRRCGGSRRWRSCLLNRASADAPFSAHFQFRSLGDQALAAIGVTMPPWPREGEAVLVQGTWKPTAMRDEDDDGHACAGSGRTNRRSDGAHGGGVQRARCDSPVPRSMPIRRYWSAEPADGARKVGIEAWFRRGVAASESCPNRRARVGGRGRRRVSGRHVHQRRTGRRQCIGDGDPQAGKYVLLLEEAAAAGSFSATHGTSIVTPANP